MTRKDSASPTTSRWPSLLILAFGVLVLGYAYSAMRNDVSILFWGMGWVLGPLFILIGGRPALLPRRTESERSPGNQE